MPIESEQPSLQNALPEYPLTLLDFQRMFPDETACLRYLEKIRWPDGFVCGKCATVGERRALILSATFFLYARMLYGKKIQAHHTQ